MNRTLEFRVGLVALVAMGLLAYLVLQVEDVKPWRQSYLLDLTFRDVQRLGEGDQVRLNGVLVGKVHSVDLDKGRVLVRVEIEHRAQILRGSHITVGTAGFFGQNYIKIEQPPGETTGETYQPHEKIEGDEETGYEQLLSEAEHFFSRARAAMSSLNKILADQQFRADIKQSASNIERFTRNSADMMARTEQRVADLLDNLRDTSTNLKDITSENREPVRQTIEDLHRLVTDVRDVLAENREGLRRSMEELADLSRGLNANGETARQVQNILDHLDGVTRSLDEEGDLGQSFREIADNFTAASEDIRSLSSKTREIVTDPEFESDIRGAVKDLGEVSSKVGSVTNYLDRLDVGLSTVTAYADTGDFGSEVLGKVTYDDRYSLRIGREDFDAPQGGVNVLQGGVRVWDVFQIRSGMFRDRAGVGVDAELLDRKLLVSIEAFDWSDLVYRVAGKYAVSGRYGVTVRVEDINQPGTRTYVGVSTDL